MLAEVQARQVPKKELAWSSTAGWFTHLAGVKQGQGHRTVEQAPLLVTERTATHAAMLAGPDLPGAGRGDRGRGREAPPRLRGA